MSSIVMRVRRLVTDPFTRLSSLVLEDESGRERLELAIGVHEAPAIATELQQVAMDRPMPHDLIKAILGQCGASVDRVELTGVQDGAFLAAIRLRLPGGGNTTLDARPSDAIGLALRTGSDIHVARRVLEGGRRRQRGQARGGAQDRPIEAGDLPGGAPSFDEGDPLEGLPADLGAWLLETIPDEDFGKWKM